jgi:hypothetical protein
MLVKHTHYGILYHGIVEPLPIMLGKVPSWPIRAKLGDTQHNGQGQDHSMALRCGVMADSTNFFIKIIMFSRQYFSYSYKCIDHHWKITSQNVVKKNAIRKMP